MNERIRLLAEQAGALQVKSVLNIPAALSLNGDEIQKFAELIVRECIWALWTEECRTSDLASEEYTRGSNKIKEHFGVEEQVNDSKELHTCPYREEIHNDYESLCDCDEEQQHQCAMDI